MTTTAEQTVEDFFKPYPTKKFSKGQILLRPDEKLKYIFYLTDGQVVCHDISTSGNEIVLNAFKPGAFFPTSNAINNVENRYFFKASTDISIKLVPVNDVLRFLRYNPEVMYDLLSRVYKGTDGLMRRMAHMMGSDAENRVIFEVLNAAWRFGIKNDDGSVKIKLTESDLAKRCGLARETFSRSIKPLKQKDLITVVSTGIIVKDLDALEKLLNSGL